MRWQVGQAQKKKQEREWTATSDADFFVWSASRTNATAVAILLPAFGAGVSLPAHHMLLTQHSHCIIEKKYGNAHIQRWYTAKEEIVGIACT
jgi:hypothetical protein